MARSLRTRTVEDLEKPRSAAAQGLAPDTGVPGAFGRHALHPAGAVFRFRQCVRAQISPRAGPPVPGRARPGLRSGDRDRPDRARSERAAGHAVSGDHAAHADPLRPDPRRRAPDHPLQGERRALLRVRGRGRNAGGRRSDRLGPGRCALPAGRPRDDPRRARRGLRALGDDQRARARLRAARAAGARERGDRARALSGRGDPAPAGPGRRRSSRARRSRASRWCSRASIRPSGATSCRP